MSIQDQVIAGLQADVAAAVMEFWDSDYSQKCQSEIERSFAASVLLALTFHGTRIGASREHAKADGVGQFLEPQFVIGDYRVDFLYGRTDHPDLLKCIAIECDGHEFHDRTKEQAARDKARDRYLSARVGRVLRFTGSELYRDPMACGIEATKVLHVITMGFAP